jgi:formylglycine-generating enzyme required for sulfatase activity
VLAGVAALVLLGAGAVLYAALRSPAVAAQTRIRAVLSPAVAAKVGDVWTNSIGMRLAYVPAGGFVMGSPEGQGGGDERPQHRVQLGRPVLMGMTEVTQWQYQEVMGSNPSFITGNENYPVEQVSWDDAMEFCRRLGAREGRSYRLPTEAEWEYACRAGLAEADGGVSRLDQTAWYIANSGSKTRAVGMRRANAWGLYDMHGNVWEWCMDWYGPYGEGEAADPAGAEEGKARVARGGSWYRDPEQCGAASRIAFEPGMRLNELGFRVVLENPGRRDR